jgi:hypothetical protein
MDRVAMSIHSPDLPSLTLNHACIQEFIRAQQPCCALGLVEVQNRPCAFIALCPGTTISPVIPSKGFLFSHTLIGNSDIKVIHFGFELNGFQSFNVLLNPNNPIVRKVLQTMIVSGDYFFLTLDKFSRSITGFRSEMGQDTLAHLRDNWEQIQQSSMTDEQYLQSAIHFVKNSDPKEELLQWVCSDNIDYLDLTQDRLEIHPA